MEASKVTISQKTFQKLHEGPLTAKRKKQLRLEGVKEYIRSFPVGTPLRTYELIKAAGYMPSGYDSKPYRAGTSYINNLVKRGIIKRFNRDGFKSEYCIVGDAKTTKLAKPMLQAKVQVVERDLENEVPDKPYKVKTDHASSGSGKGEYSFEITVSKRNKDGDFGRTRMGQLEMTDVDVETIRKMLNELLDNVS